MSGLNTLSRIKGVNNQLYRMQLFRAISLAILMAKQNGNRVDSYLIWVRELMLNRVISVSDGIKLEQLCQVPVIPYKAK